MRSDLSEQKVTIRAAFSSYLVLSGVWVLLAVGYLLLGLRNPAAGSEKGAAIAGGVALLWWCWLLGFKITVTKELLEYRDGFFRSTKVALSDIVQIQNAGVEWSVLNRRFRVPRLLVIVKNEVVAMSINPKPFKRSDLKIVREAISD